MNDDSKYLIIAAEDCRSDVFLLRTALNETDLKYELKSLDDGDDVLKFIDQIDRDPTSLPPHLFVVDLNMPKRSGEEVFQRLRRSDKLAKIPVIVVTSSSSPMDRARATELGAAAFFQKPVDLDEFMLIGKVIRRVLTSDPT